MRILLLAHAFNALTQRLHCELRALGHEVSLELDIHDDVTREAVALFQPHLILAPYLRRAIPEDVWRAHVCLVLHPGPVGDRGPSALDWALLRGEARWGATLLQAEGEMDAGPVWATESFPMRAAMKSSLYRQEVTEAALRLTLSALERWPEHEAGRWRPQRAPLQPMHALATQADRRIDWLADGATAALAKIHSGDGFPGVADSLAGEACHLFHARPWAARGEPGRLLGRAGEGVVRATRDGALWIGHVRRPGGIKLPATRAFPELLALPELAATPDIAYEEIGPVGYLHFRHYNGALSARACRELRAAWLAARERPVKALVLCGGEDFFCNGLDLNAIEAADSPADASWENIQAMDDLCLAILETDNQLSISALAGNAGAGGAFLALAADAVWARRGVVLNPHYKNMGNLHGSEYWTYLLPRRLGEAGARALMRERLPMTGAEAARSGFIDAAFGEGVEDFRRQVRARAEALVAEHAALLAAKRARRAADEAAKPLAAYRAEELECMRRNFFGFDPSYHVARKNFVLKTPHSWTPRHLAIHRDAGWRVGG